MRIFFRPFPARRSLRTLCFVAPLLVLNACAGGHTLVPTKATMPAATEVAWLAPVFPADVAMLSRWRSAVGSPLIRRTATPGARAAVDSLTIVSWNIALGAGDVVGMVRQVEEQTDGPIVLLLQEAFRSGDDIPQTARDGAFAGFLGNSDAAREIDAVADALGYSLYYVPSMRNGAPGRHDEDRGNAILTNLPLEDLTAIELPFERQRRVAVTARIRGTTRDGQSWSVRVASVHLDNTGSVRRMWVGGEYGRARQARGLREALRGDEPTILAGDFNTWFGFADRAYQELAFAYPNTRMTDRRRTFRGLLRLDHVFYRVSPEWQVDVRRAESALGSDHHALITRITFASASSTASASRH